MKITKSVFSMSDFLSWQKSGDLVLSPKFQRRSVWSPSAKSYLVDTISRDLPVPIIIIRKVFDMKTYKEYREVVDGQQRLRTMLGFIDKKCLKDYSEKRDGFKVKRTHNPDIAGKSFSELPEEYKYAIMSYEFSVHILPSGTTDTEVLQIFSRLNSSGVGLNKQEIRNAEFSGVFKTLVYDLAVGHIEKWRRWKAFNENNFARMEEVETASDVIIMIIEGLIAKSQAKISSYYKNYDDDFEFVEQIQYRFNKVMEEMDASIGDILSESPLSRKTILPILIIFYHDLIFGKSRDISSFTVNELPRNIKSAILEISNRLKNKINLPEDAADALRGATDNIKSRNGLYEFFYKVVINDQP